MQMVERVRRSTSVSAFSVSPCATPQATVHGSPNLVYINVSPIEYGHVLLVPRVMDCLPQVWRWDW